VIVRSTREKKRRIIRVNALSFAQLVKYMNEGTYTCMELAELTGLHYVTVLQYTREMHRAKAAHISMWEKDSWGRDAIKVYKIGRGKDAQRESMTRAEIAARYRAKKKGRDFINILKGEHESNHGERSGVGCFSEGAKRLEAEGSPA
jgi:hypothetical protein